MKVRNSPLTKWLIASAITAFTATALAQTQPTFIANSHFAHSYYHGSLASQTPSANNVGTAGTLRFQASWQTAADLDIRVRLPDAAGPYVGSNKEIFPIKNTLFTDTEPRHVWSGQKTVTFNNGQATAALDVDVRNGVANAPNNQRVENIYINGKIPSGTYSFAVENYDNSHYYRNNPANPATNFDMSVTLAGAGYLIPSDNIPFDLSTGYAYGVKGSISGIGAVSPVYSVNYFNPGLDTLHASGVDFFKRFNDGFLSSAYTNALGRQGAKPSDVIDVLRNAKTPANALDADRFLNIMGEAWVKKEFDRLYKQGQSALGDTFNYIDQRTGQSYFVGRGNFTKALNAFDTNTQQKKLGDEFLAALPEQTRREFQAIQKLHGAYPGNTQALRTAENNFVSMGQVDDAIITASRAAIQKNQAAVHKLDTTIHAQQAAIQSSCTPLATCAIGNIGKKNTALAWTEPNSAVTGFLGKEIQTQTYRVPITTWKTEWTLLGKIAVIDKTTTLIVSSKEEALRLLAIEAEKGKKASSTNDFTVGVGSYVYDGLDYVPLAGEAKSLNQAITGDDGYGGTLSTGERFLAGFGAIPILGKAKKAESVIVNIAVPAAEKELKQLAEASAKQAAIAEAKQIAERQAKEQAEKIAKASAEKLAETKLKNGMEMSTKSALETAEKYLGKGYKEIDNGVFKSADGKTMVRFTDSDLSKIDNHAGSPHMNIEFGNTNIKNNGKESFSTIPGQNYHIYLPEEK
jgi:hypothetical protein